MKLSEKLCIYGNHYFVLAEECYGCFNFNYLCGGPDSEGCCPSRQFEKSEACKIANTILSKHLDGNNYAFARVVGFTKDCLAQHKEKLKDKLSTSKDDGDIKEYKLMINAIDKALGLEDNFIETLRLTYNIED